MDHQSEGAKPRLAMLEKIQGIAATATPQEREMIDQIIAQARTGEQTTTTATFTPAACALLVVKCNDWNRAFAVDTVHEYVRRIQAGQWKWNGQGVSFYKNGSLGDGQHRLMGHALAGATWHTSVAFGVDQADVVTIDNGRSRQAADHAGMAGVKDAGRKQTIVKTAGSYFAKTGVVFAALKSAAELAAAIKAHDLTLSKAIELGDGCIEGLAPGVPCLSRNECAKIAFVMLFGGWPTERVVRTLRRLQSGTAIEAEGGETNPLYVARGIIDAKTRGQTIQAVKQIGLVLNAAMKVEAGTKASARVLKAEIAKELPTPLFAVLEKQVLSAA
jgi:hypothetical protein